jgi:RNA polymerase sigma-70 factor (ECF subfamily)
MSEYESRIEVEIPALRRYARALARDVEGAEDLLQDCLEKALGRRHLLVHYDNFRGWLFRMMRNIHLNDLRRRRQAGSEVDLDHAGQTASPPDQITRIEVTETLAAFDRLSPDHREALLLTVIEGLAYREASEILGVPAGTLMARVSRAREELRALCQAPAHAHLRRVK